MHYKVIAKLDEKKYKSCEGMDPNLWPMLKDKIYTLNIWNSLEMAEWSANGHRNYKWSNLDLDTVEIIEVD